MMRCLQISQSTDTKVLLIPISEALFICEEGFFTEWKLGNTSNEKLRNPAFGGVFFCLMQWSISALLVALMHWSGVKSLVGSDRQL